MRQHFSSVLNKDAEKIIFFRRKLYLFIPDYDDAAYQVDGQTVKAEDWPFTLRMQLMAKGRTETGQ